MINRELIRLKIVQLVYAYYQNGNKNIDVAVKELFFSLSKAYDLYRYLLLLMVDITKYGTKLIDAETAKNKRLKIDEAISRKFIENKFIAQLAENKQLLEYVENEKRTWADEQDFIKSLYDKIVTSDIYNAYMAMPDSTYADDRELWRKLYKEFVFNNEELDQILEDKSLYWNDDKEIVDTFVLKTIKRFDEANGANQELLPEYHAEEDREFAERLFRKTLLNADYYRHLMSNNARNWEFNRLAYMDVVIMQIALAEMLSFPNIPVSVTLNEYIELAKLYSTPKSGGYINGLLDNIAKQLIKENKLIKSK